MRIAIIGAGISGITAAYHLHKNSDAEIDIYEATDRIGGVIATEHFDGCVLEGGPDSFLTQKKAASELCIELGLQSELVPSNDNIRKTFLLNNGMLKPLPEGMFLMVPAKLGPFLKTDLISWHGKLAALRELFEYPQETDCTVAEFIEKRFGSEISQQIAEPLLAGVYGGSIHRLSMKSALPQVWEMQKKGSMILTLFRKMPAKSESLFTTLSKGMESLILALREKCSRIRWQLSSPVTIVEGKKGQWIVRDQVYDRLLLAGSSVPEMPVERGKQIRELIQSVRRNSAIVITLCYQNLHRKGFGWLIPQNERKLILAGTYVSNKFPGRSPADRFLIRLFIGGENANRWIDASDEKLMDAVTSDLQRIDSITDAPLFYRIFRWKNAMPEYEIGHQEKVSLIRKLAMEEKGLFLTGNIFGGVGIPDCIQHARKTAEEMIQP